MIDISVNQMHSIQKHKQHLFYVRVYFLRFLKPFLTKAITDILCHFKVTSPLLIEIC